VGAGGAMIAIGDSMDGHPKNHPEVVSRRGDPNVGIPIAITGAVVFVVGAIVFFAVPTHNDAKR
jgi:hypothetical protein